MMRERERCGDGEEGACCKCKAIRQKPVVARKKKRSRAVRAAPAPPAQVRFNER